MKTVIRTKKINGIDYLYEITYYYDKESKRTRQHSRYLGKAIDGKPVKSQRDRRDTENGLELWRRSSRALPLVKNMILNAV